MGWAFGGLWGFVLFQAGGLHGWQAEVVPLPTANKAIYPVQALEGLHGRSTSLALVRPGINPLAGPFSV